MQTYEFIGASFQSAGTASHIFLAGLALENRYHSRGFSRSAAILIGHIKVDWDARFNTKYEDHKWLDLHQDQHRE